MEASGVKNNRGRRRPQIKIENEALENKYEHSLSFYLEPPDDSISLQEFEDYAVARLKLLRTIERVNLTSTRKYSNEWLDEIRKELKKQKLDYFAFPILPPKDDMSKLFEARRLDHLSHYILRLAYCKTEESRKWMISMEVEFFRFKYATESYQALQRFMAAHEMSYKPMDKQLQEEMKVNLQNANFDMGENSILTNNFYEVPFTEVLDLVRSRKVFIRKGIAYVPHKELSQIFVSKFRSNLSQALSVTSKLMQRVEDDERVGPILNDFEKRHTGRNFGGNKGKEKSVTAEMLPDLSQRSFPLCMKNLYEVVRKDSHVKHWGRLQLGLFFKGLGLPLDDSIYFWRSNFTRKAGMDGTKFDKQYLYNIRHMYGQEGKRADYTPHSCMKIIMSNVGPGEHHGCPFRHSDPTPLRVKLADANISATGIKEIMELAEKTHYSIACQKYFEWVHNKATVDGGINHPNQYFEESQKVLNGTRSKTSDIVVNKTKVNVYSQDTTKSQQPLPPVKDWALEDEDEIMATLDEVDNSEIVDKIADD